jgi:hypothetical protein
MGVFSSPSIPLDGLIFSIDAGNIKSYSGSGTNVLDTINNISGVMNNGVVFSNLMNGYFSFDGTDDKILYPLNSAYDISQSITIEAHIRPTNYPTAGGGGMIITKVASYYLELASSGKIRVYFEGVNSPGYHESVGTVYLNFWTHVAVTRDFANNTINIYINGVLDRTISGITGNITVQQTYTLSVGGYSAGGYLFVGHIACGKIYNRTLSAQEISQLYNSAKDRYSYKEDIVKNGLLLNYDIASPLSYINPSTTIQSTINNYPGTLINGPTFNSGNSGYLSFDGTNDYINIIPSTTSFTYNRSSFTVGGWTYMTSLPVSYYGVILSKWNTGGGNDNEFILNTDDGNKFLFAVDLDDSLNPNSQSNDFVLSTTVIVANTWYYVVGTFENGLSKIYINGILESSIQSSFSTVKTNLNSSLDIGRFGTTFYSTGRRGVVHFYNRALSATEVLYNFNALRGRYGI